MKTIKFLVLFYLMMPSLSIEAQFIQQGPKLVNASYAVDGLQGYSVDISADGNTAIVGVPYDGITGGAIIYTLSNGEWRQQGNKLVGNDYTLGQFTGLNQGASVAISGDGNTVAIGDPNDNDYLGAVYVFVKTNGNWVRQGKKLSASGLINSSGQGNSVDLSYDGNTLVFGAPLIYIGNAAYKGGVFVYKRNGSNWIQQGNKLYSGDTRNVPNHEGWAVAISGDGTTIVAGAPGRLDNIYDGGVYFYALKGGIWQPTKGFTGYGNLGAAVSIDYNGTTVAVGAPTLSSKNGSVSIFTLRGVWENTTNISVSNAGGKYNQGESVSISADGTRIVFGGGSNYSYSALGLGQAWVYTKIGNAWIEDSQKYQGTGAVGNAQQGISIALSGDGKTFIVGGAEDDDGKGAAWVFATQSSTTSVFSDVKEDGDIFIFPNPSNGNFILDFGKGLPNISTITIVDMLGKEVYRQEVGASTKKLGVNLVGLPVGVYMARIQEGQNNTVLRALQLQGNYPGSLYNIKIE